MKYLFYAILAVFLATFSTVSAIPLSEYSIQESIEPFEIPTGGTKLGPFSAFEDFLSDEIPIGFTFHYDNQTFTSFKMCENGFISLNSNHVSPGLNIIPYSQYSTFAKCLCPLNLDFRVRGSFGYKLEGEAPNRVLICYWDSTDFLSVRTDYADAQFLLKLYEGEVGMIKFQYGNNCANILPAFSKLICLFGNAGNEIINIAPGLETSTFYRELSISSNNRYVNSANQSALVFGKTYTFNGTVLENPPIVSYITPDIGTPGMSTYMEIIGPNNAFGNFGDDGMLFNNSYNDTQLKIEFMNPADSLKISFGSLSVSWDGRMIATQVFVNPNLPIPNSMHWTQLSPENIVQFRVRKGDLSSDWQTFYIVKPYNFNNLSDNTTDLVFGEGNLGLRSPRGCMLVDSLRLALATYTVSTNDCDPNTAGNQGFLPFILLSKGNITGRHTYDGADHFTVIDVSGGSTGNAENAGPGGGGGGGRFCDAHYIGSYSRGSDGGKGFVSGGRGGLNNSSIPGVSNEWKSLGDATGENGKSMNGINPPADAWYECSGGATGHPFGTSGKGSYVQEPTETNNAGGYGGGSGHTQQTKGGGGAYATPGLGSNAFNAGKIHGNNLIVPIGGGSGGASGNPQGPGSCSGSGGGGGGAIRIFAPTISTLYIKADGANGGNGDNSSNGGGGSGGYIGIFAKTRIDQVRSSVLGGMSGNSGSRTGSGRIRLDAQSTGNGIITYPENVTETKYIGFTIDTTRLVARNCKLRGSKQEDDNLFLYFKGQTEQYWHINDQLISDPGTTWQANLSLTGTDSIYYVFAAKRILNSGRVDSCQYLPTFDFSQSAANILIIDKFPAISGDTTSSIDAGLYCAGTIKYDTVKIFNTGLAPLKLKMQNAIFRHNTPGFDFSPKTELIVPQNDSTNIIISYTIQEGFAGSIADTLEIAHNDSQTELKNPWEIACDATVIPMNVEYTDSEGNSLEALDFGTLCTGGNSATLPVTVHNGTIASINIDHIRNAQGETSPFAAEFISPLLIENNASGTINIRFAPPIASPGLYSDTLFLYLTDCDACVDTLFVSANTLNANFTISENPINLGNICANDIVSKQIILYNQSEFDLEMTFRIDNISGISAKFAADSTLKAYDSLSVIINLNTNNFSDDDYTGTIVFSSKNCDSKASADIIFSVHHSEIEYADNIDFGSVEVGHTAKDYIIIKNTGSSSLYYDEYPTVNPPFSVTSSVPTLPALIQPGETIKFEVSYSPTASGTFSDSLIILSLQENDACAARAAVFVAGEASIPSVILSKYSIDFGLLPNCQQKTDSIKITNVGQFEVKIDSASIVGPNKESFKIIAPNTTSYIIIAPEESIDYVISFDGHVPPAEVKNAELKFYGSIEMPSATLTGESEEIDLVLTPESPINVGGIPVGETREIEINFTNNARLPLDIHSITATNATVNTNTMALNSGETKPLIITINMDKAGKKDITVTYTITEPCPETRTIQLNSVGLEGNVTYASELDFGLPTSCESPTKDLLITNSGDANIILNSARIEGTDAALFELISQPEYPLTLAPEASQILSVKFNSANATNGIKTADLICNLTINNKPVELTTNLKVDLRSGLFGNPMNVVFDNTRVNSSNSKQIKISNNGVDEVKITNISLPQNSEIFSVTPNLENYSLPLGGNTSLNVLFAPKEIATYQDVITVYYTVRDCPDSLVIDLNGISIPATKIHLRLPDITEIDPAADYLNIPVYAYLENSESDVPISNINIDMSFELNGLLFVAQSIMPADHSFTQSLDSYQNRTITSNLTNITVGKEERIIATISGVPLLGDAKYTDMKFTRATTDNLIDISEIITKDGSLAFKICENGSDRLLNYSNPLSVKISPNPPTDGKFEIEVSTLEAGSHRITIVNSLGETLYSASWNNLGNDNLTKHFTINSENYPSGAYIIKIDAPNATTNKRLQIIK